MERNFKIFVYPYTDKDVVDDKQWRLIGKYGSEGYFFENLRQGHFLTQDPDKRLIFSSFPFLVISCVERYNLDPFALPAGGNNLKNRTVLAFWAGRCSSDIRDELIQSWQNDTDLDIQNKRADVRNTKGRIVYQEKFLRSRFCICPGAPHVHGARIAEAIHYGCVPVILSDYSVLPFNDILDWRKFSVVIKEKDVHQL
ncbi:EXOSTOSIN HEPARAN SULFATE GLYCOSYLTRANSFERASE -RELATED [Salix koriyanagi]|uniref:EXOSTOSIN HEPARAN SULFATE GLYCOSYLTRANSFERASE -RELATED n=1 Tax=Salix koriyanagi TaxID=2511006 RepID=A0A9Q0ZGN0_9ROSI|nr:EXOSTOSIN HEPARAN SULFATE GLYCOSYLTRANSFERASE -RELATED [Salix koriyanagi]